MFDKPAHYFNPKQLEHARRSKTKQQTAIMNMLHLLLTLTYPNNEENTLNVGHANDLSLKQ